MVIENDSGTEPLLLQAQVGGGGYVLIQTSTSATAGPVLIQAGWDTEPVLVNVADGQVVFQDNSSLTNVVIC